MTTAKRIFVIRPFGREFQSAYVVMRQVAAELGVTLFRLDEIATA